MISLKSLNIWKDGLEGILANIIQNIFFSLFFIILVRNYSKINIGYYLISNILYSTISSISGLGIGNSYVRSHQESSDKSHELNIFMITLFISGFIMCLVNMACSWFIYPHTLVHRLSLIFCVHILLDNMIYIFRNHQFALDKQKTAYRVAVLDSFLKCLTGCILFFHVLDIYALMLLVSILRVLFVMLVWLMYMPTGTLLAWSGYKKNILYVFKNNFQKNWRFITITGLAILNWRTGSFMVSTSFSMEDVTEYEVAFKLLGLAYMIPVVFCNSIYPRFVSLREQKEDVSKLFRQTLIVLMGYGFLCFTIMMSFADQIIPLLFGKGHEISACYTRYLFIIMIPYPLVLLQAGYLISKGYESVDLQGNLIVLIVTLVFSLAGLHFSHGVLSIIIALCLSFIIFLLYQDYILHKINKYIKKNQGLIYVTMILIPVTYYCLNQLFKGIILFPFFWISIICIIIIYKRYMSKAKNGNFISNLVWAIKKDK